jgi:hypothetical protein
VEEVLVAPGDAGVTVGLSYKCDGDVDDGDDNGGDCDK